MPSPTTHPDDVIRVQGRVLDPDGKPAAGAMITVPGTWHWDKPLQASIVAHATADAEGRFEIAFSKADVSIFSHGGGDPGSDDWKTAKIVASAPNLGVDFCNWNTADANGELILKLVRDEAPIRGRIVDEAGKPVEGVNIAVDMLIEKADASEQEPMSRASFEKRMLSQPLLVMGNAKTVKTDADGRFEIHGLGSDRTAYLRLIGPTIAYTRFGVDTVEKETKITRTPQPAGFDTESVTYGATFEHKAAPAQSVEGIVKDAADGKPIAGVLVESLRFSGNLGIDPQRLLTCVTDASGHYRLDGFPRGQDNSLIVVPSDGQPYFMYQEALGNPPDDETETIDIELHRGVIITGKVTDKVTHTPVPARLVYTTYVDNPAVATIPEFRHEEGGFDLDGFQSRYETQPDGTFHVVAAPGKAIVGAWLQLGGYRIGVGFNEIPLFSEKNWMFALFQPAPIKTINHVVREIDVPADAKEVVCNLEVDPGEHVQVTVIDPDGKPAARPLQARGQNAETYGGPYFHKIDGPTFEARGFEPLEERTLFIIDDGRKLGRAVRTTPEAGDIEIALKPLGEVSGRLVNTKGAPLAGIDIEISDANKHGRTARATTTDKDGRFATSVPVGVTYEITVSTGTYVGATVAESVVPEPGPNADLGEIEIKPLR